MTPVYTGSVSDGVKRKSNRLIIKDTIELDFSLFFLFPLLRKMYLLAGYSSVTMEWIAVGISVFECKYYSSCIIRHLQLVMASL